MYQEQDFSLRLQVLLDLSQKNCQLCSLTVPQSKTSFQCLYFLSLQNRLDFKSIEFQKVWVHFNLQCCSDGD